MIDSLNVINLKANTPVNTGNGEVFVLKTCQRTLVLGFGQLPFYHLEDQNNIRDVFTGNAAYIFLLETICGLNSEVLAEYEVVGQFKEAYQNYLKLDFRNTHIINLLEKLFKDSKKVRTEHLTEIGQLSYAGITRKMIHSRISESDVLIVGSGAMAEDLIKLLKKKHRLFITARNSEKVQELAALYSLEVIPWNEFGIYKNFPSIVNTIGADEILFDHQFFLQWREAESATSLKNDLNSKLFIDLGSPSVINTTFTESDGVLRLEDIFHQSTKLNIEKMEKISRAKDSINLLAQNRRMSFSMSYPFGWEELQFA